MNVKMVQWALFTMFVFVPCSSAFGADCDSVLVPTHEEARSNHAVALSYLKLIKESEYQKLTHDGSAGLSIPIVKGLVEASTSYSDFLDKRKAYLEQTQFNYSEQESMVTLKTHLSDTSINVWLKCKTENVGVFLSGRDVTKKSFILRMDWHPPNNVPAALASIEIEGGTYHGKSETTFLFTGNFGKTIPVTRKPYNSDVKVTVNVGGYTEDIFIEAVKPPPPIPPPILLFATSDPYAHLSVFTFAQHKPLKIFRVEAATCGGEAKVYTHTPLGLRGDAGPPAEAQSPLIQSGTTYRFDPPLDVPATETGMIWFNCNDSKFYGTVPLSDH